MAKRTYKIAIYNDTNHALKLDEVMIYWGYEESLPPRIEPKQTQTYSVYSPSGATYGLEFYLTLSDECPPNEACYGTITIAIEIPFWQQKNRSECFTTGLLQVNGFQHIPDGVHNFETSIVASKKK